MTPRRSNSRPCLSIPALLTAALPACMPDHDSLARPPTLAESSGGSFGQSPGSAQDASVEAGDAESFSDVAVRGEAASDGLTRDASVADRVWSLSLVHGVTDSTAPIQFCFARVVEGQETLLGVPAPATGLEYGRIVQMDALDSVDLASEGVRPYVLSGELARVRDLECEAAVALARELERSSSPSDAAAADTTEASAPVDAGGADAHAKGDASGLRPDARVDDAGAPSAPPLRVGALAVLPPGTMSTSKSYLLATGGCLGGAAYSNAAQESLCGELYAPEQPTLAMYFVALDSAPDGEQVGLQVLNATPAFTPATLRFAVDADAPKRTIVEAVVTGQLAPPTARVTWDRNELAATEPGARLYASLRQSTAAAFETPWPEVLTAGDLTRLENGANYTLVLAGPHPGFESDQWWNGPVVTIVPNSPR